MISTIDIETEKRISNLKDLIDVKSESFLEAFNSYIESGKTSSAYLQRKYKLDFEPAYALSRRIPEYEREQLWEKLKIK